MHIMVNANRTLYLDDCLTDTGPRWYFTKKSSMKRKQILLYSTIKK